MLDLNTIRDEVTDICSAIEACGTGEAQSNAAVKASALLSKLLVEIHEQEMPPGEETLGEKIVRMRFNPSKTGLVDALKQHHAKLINLVNGIAAEKAHDLSITELDRTLMMSNIVRSMEALENSAMNAVKAATTGK